MSLSDSITIGPVTLPLILVCAISVAAAGWAVGVMPIWKDTKNRRTFGDLLSAPVLPFLIGWKLSLFISDAADVFINPAIVLYSSGGPVNILIGLCIGGSWLVYRWKKLKPERTVNLAMIRSMAVVSILAAGIGIGLSFWEKSSDGMEKAPFVEFTGTKGETWSPESALGTTVVLNFWASWCPPCKAEMPMLERLQTDVRFETVVFYAVNARRTEKNPDDARVWLEENGISLPLMYDDSGYGTSLFRVSALPTTIIINPEGKIVEHRTGAVSRSWILRSVRKARRSVSGG